MNPCIVQSGDATLDQFLESIFTFSHLLIREFIKGLSPNQAIFVTFTIAIYHYIVHKVSTP